MYIDIVKQNNLIIKNILFEQGHVCNNEHMDTVFPPATVSMVPDRGVASHGEECQVG